MPRGKKKIDPNDYENLIAEIDNKIADYEQSIKSLKGKKKDLIAQKKNADLILLAEAVKESGKSVEEAIRVIREH